MNSHEFTLILDRAPNDEEYDALFEAGCDDAVVEVRNGTTLLDFTRESPTLARALITAIEDAERAGFRVEGVQTDDLVSLRTIADRLGRSYESVRLLATARRGPGGFPSALSGDGWALYSWAQVADWSTRHLDAQPSVDAFEIEIAATNHLLRARNLLQGRDNRTEYPKVLNL
ncbi:hypothetical protein SAMN05421805_115127 [Saccharopolyspora antimicrobica]|uniref:DNA-binding protein n=1 Tax=Saccharopolyspora antimicrobica TaxID=455193 RepID=A0A1I5HHF5_9PSEU|nr:hypothetical protein [Saccharopolyspora antimicrobica]RKT85296.1 hypothetical protein ATL45_3635 [Saccharopolyspora antimicrobica]SFO47657.1 hypothetical protein SAMN05421805_115127 [Saccharopolyspora antimicrobica]